MGEEERSWGALPAWKCGNFAPESGVVHIVEDDTQERNGFIARVWSELGLIEDDGGGDRGGE